MKYLTHYDNFVHYIDFKKLLKEFDNKNFTFFNTNAHAFFIQNQKHISDLFMQTEVSAACTQNIFHFTDESIVSAKKYLKELNINIRI